jgi:hypothetical protein
MAHGNVVVHRYVMDHKDVVVVAHRDEVAQEDLVLAHSDVVA